MEFDDADFAVAALSLALALAAYLAATRQNRLSAVAYVADWRRDVRSWACEAVGVLAELEAADEASSTEARHPNRTRLSALIDQGRFLLPNVERDRVGLHKPAAYRGWRHRALDPLVAVARLIDGQLDSAPFPSVGAAIASLRREFVSEVFTVIDPEAANRSVADLLDVAREASDSDRAARDDESEVPPGAAGALRIAAARRAGGVVK